VSETRVAAASDSAVTRKNWKTGATAGSGGNRRFYTGRNGDFDYRSFVTFLMDSAFWLGVGRIVSAVMTVYTDDDGGSEGEFVKDTDAPHLYTRRLISAYSHHTNSASFVSGDYTNPTNTTTGAVGATPNPAALIATQIDVTALVEAIAPKTVRRRDGTPGGAAPNYGFLLFGNTAVANHWAGVSSKAESGLNASKPVLTLTYDFGVTTPNAPSNLSPVGAVGALDDFEGDFSDPRTTDTLRESEVEVYTADKSGTAATTDIVTVTAHGLANGDFVYFTSLTGGAGLSTFTRYCVRDKTTNTFKVTTGSTSAGAVTDITTAYTALKVATLLYHVAKIESDTAITAGRFSHVPSALSLKRLTNYQWRARVLDNESQWSPYSALVTFSVTNTAPTAPILTPNAITVATLANVAFGGNFSDPDSDKMLAYQVQMNSVGSGDPSWDDDSALLWNTGKRLVTSDTTLWFTPYGGVSLSAGTYYWRARVWDAHNAVSNWTYATITLTADFEVDPSTSVNAIQLKPRAPWRIVIRAMGTNRGPGAVVAILEDAYSVGASLMYNSPGEAHWTLGIAHPQISVIEPKQTHYAIEFRQGDGWREVFAGLVDDFDATDRDVIFYGKDYLALLQSSLDTRYDPANPDKAAEKGGSKYVTSGKNDIGYIVHDQLEYARTKANSPTGFITSVQSAATLTTFLTEKLTIFSTYAYALPFIVGLLDSHRAGTGKRTRIFCEKQTDGSYKWRITDDPGIVRDNLRMRYGELVQGYRVVAFGNGWGTRVGAIGRAKDGVLVRYTQQVAPGIDEAVWGRWESAQFYDGISDANDLDRKARQSAIAQSKLGKQLGVGLREGVLQPRDGYELCDVFPVDIEHGAVSTSAMGSGYWAAVGITWVADGQKGGQNTILTLLPREDGTAPSTDLLQLEAISPQAEWQIGWAPPNPLLATARYWLDQTTGIAYTRTSGAIVADPVTSTT
jgi:hypothetical protein